MDIRRMRSVCDNCKHEEDDLFILSIADKSIILCINCLDELKDLNSNHLFLISKEENK